ncbi:MAG: glycosyltransferase family 2 protein [Methylobacter sp.]|nr:glycosyltransferase family 2 protein [Methylobacter sp.]MDP2100515.1 glycosyltransferase family 2 protein [Methylobacter sp.]MDP2428732.1 glycosyltransferase family 2 protein [Methylobacter sp.]MDP3053252.1 glycosyltransferase family 2 protein [Methylobacter sp.]MDP3361549.1 glycosyltransferase family 2 protein [Methylobacter sp.]
MNTAPTLSVCIPTFNRLNYLQQALAVLLPQAELYNVEVCISDNHSIDGTKQFLCEIANDYPLLRYNVNPVNTGLDENMLIAISMGKGHYIYPIGDDDILPDGSLLEILREIKNGGDVIVLNGWHTTSSLIKKWMHLSPSIAGNSFSRPDEAFIALWDKMPFGSFLASRECFSEKLFQRFMGTSHAYTGVIWDALADIEKNKGSCQVRCIEKPIVLLRGGEKSWRKDAALIMLYEIPYWFSLIMEQEIYRKIIPAIKSQFLTNQTKISVLIQFRAIGQLEKSDVVKLGRECTSEQVQKLNRVARIPQSIAQLIVKSYGKLKPIIKRMLRK